MSEIWERGEHPAQAEVHEPIVRDEDLWAHETMEPDPNEGKFLARLEGLFDTRAEAEQALSDMEDKIGANNGEIIDGGVYPWEEA